MSSTRSTFWDWVGQNPWATTVAGLVARLFATALGSVVIALSVGVSHIFESRPSVWVFAVFCIPFAILGWGVPWLADRYTKYPRRRVDELDDRKNVLPSLAITVIFGMLSWWLQLAYPSALAAVAQTVLTLIVWRRLVKRVPEESHTTIPELG